MTKRALNEPFGKFCHYVVTKLADVTKRSRSASNKRAGVPDRAATVVSN